jgi:hypothetical protein
VDGRIPVPATALAYGYDRDAVESFFAAVEARKADLRDCIAEARARSSRARAALEARGLLMAMLEDACDELTAKRRQADVVVRSLPRLSWRAAAEGPPPPEVAPVPVGPVFEAPARS